MSLAERIALVNEKIAAAARQALDKAGVAPEEIGACIVATVSPDTIVPSAACALRHHPAGHCRRRHHLR